MNASRVPGRRDPYIDGEGWLTSATRLPSPNFEARTRDTVPTLIVVHNISLPPDDFSTDSVTKFFRNELDHDAHPYFDRLRGMRVSVHFVIRRDGAVEQFVSCDERAWHAGVSSFFERERCNDFSIGIELEGSDHVPSEDAQYEALAALVRINHEVLSDRCARRSLGHRTRSQDRSRSALRLAKAASESALPTSFFPFQSHD